MGRWLSAMSLSTQRKGVAIYPHTSDEFAFPGNGRDCPYLSIRSRCIPLVGMRRLRNTYDVCLSRWGCLWPWYVIVIWTTRETFIDLERLF